MRWLAVSVLAACTTRHEPRNAWAERPSAQVNGRIGAGSLGYVDYTISLPQGLAAGKPDHYGADDVTAPAIAVAINAAPPHDLAGARDQALAAGAGLEIVAAEPMRDGYRIDLRSPDHKRWAVEVFARTDHPFSVDCLAQQASSEELGETSRALLARICSSISVR